tara:strand:+ start:1323 stop:2585 length:1263 start_codon:yes stop_codon:yes gene_type:complete
MPYYKFKSGDLFYNRLKTFPQQNFVIFDGKVYNNGVKNSKALFNNVNATPQGFLSLYELNVDRAIDQASDPPGSGSIYPFVSKDSTRVAFRTISTSNFDNSNQFQHGDLIKGKYPLTSSIKRTRFITTGDPIADIVEDNGSFKKATGNKRFILALRHTFDKYIHLSKHHAFNSASTNQPVSWDKGRDEMSLIEIPSIFYGSSIKKGSVSLKFYITGSLAAELRDTKKNGELIQVSGTYNASANDGKVGGLVLYNEGFLALTGAWTINGNFTDKYVGNTQSNPKWADFGRGANDGLSQGTLTGSTFVVDFEGVNYVPTITMLAHAEKGKNNNSMNPTFFKKGQHFSPITSSHFFEEFEENEIKLLEHTPYRDPTGSFVKQTYISKIGIYDENKNLIAIAKLANPIRKTEDREYTFKMKLDF